MDMVIELFFYMIPLILQQTTIHSVRYMRYWTVFHTQKPKDVSISIVPTSTSCLFSASYIWSNIPMFLYNNV